VIRTPASHPDADAEHGEREDVTGQQWSRVVRQAGDHRLDRSVVRRSDRRAVPQAEREADREQQHRGKDADPEEVLRPDGQRHADTEHDEPTVEDALEPTGCRDVGGDQQR
jgi:hypothetical protein